MQTQDVKQCIEMCGAGHDARWSMVAVGHFFGWVRLDSLMDRRGCWSKQKMAVISATMTYECDDDGVRLLAMKTRGTDLRACAASTRL